MEFKVFDIGYGYLKYPNQEGEIEKVQAVIGELGATMNDPDCDIFTVDNIRYVVGADVYKLGLKPMTANESDERPKNIVYKVLGLYALAKMKAEKANVITGLPHQQLDDESEMVKEVFKATHKVNLNGEDVEIDVLDVKVASQGYGTFHSLQQQRGEEVGKKKYLLVDIGFGTIIYMPIQNGRIDSKKVKTSRKMGIQRAYSNIVDEINKDFKRNFKFYRVDEFMNDGVPVQTESGIVRESIANKSYLSGKLNEYSKEIWQDIYDKYDEEFLNELDEVVFSGGSSETMEEYLRANEKQFCTFMEESQDAQVKGYGIIAEKLTAKVQAQV